MFLYEFVFGKQVLDAVSGESALAWGLKNEHFSHDSGRRILLTGKPEGMVEGYWLNTSYGGMFC